MIRRDSDPGSPLPGHHRTYTWMWQHVTPSMWPSGGEWKLGDRRPCCNGAWTRSDQKPTTRLVWRSVLVKYLVPST